MNKPLLQCSFTVDSVLWGEMRFPGYSHGITRHPSPTSRKAARPRHPERPHRVTQPRYRGPEPYQRQPVGGRSSARPPDVARRSGSARLLCRGTLRLCGQDWTCRLASRFGSRLADPSVGAAGTAAGWSRLFMRPNSPEHGLRQQCQGAEQTPLQQVPITFRHGVPPHSQVPARCGSRLRYPPTCGAGATHTARRHWVRPVDPG
jgi:hypothetical protein